MNPSSDIAEFLASRRAKITPEQAGLPSFGARRVPGLRREEVASLAGVSADYYRRLERGQVSGASELVLDALARALQLDEAERAHLFDLARAAGQQRPLHLPGPSGARLLPRLGSPGLRAGRQSALARRPRPLRPKPSGPDRRAVHAQRRVPRALGRAQRALPPHGNEASASSGRRRD